MKIIDDKWAKIGEKYTKFRCILKMDHLDHLYHHFRSLMEKVRLSHNSERKLDPIGRIIRTSTLMIGFALGRMENEVHLVP